MGYALFAHLGINFILPPTNQKVCSFVRPFTAAEQYSGVSGLYSTNDARLTVTRCAMKLLLTCVVLAALACALRASPAADEKDRDSPAFLHSIKR